MSFFRLTKAPYFIATRRKNVDTLNFYEDFGNPPPPLLLGAFQEMETLLYPHES